MAHGDFLLAYAAIAVISLIVLIAKYKMNPFIVLILVSVLLGLAVGMPVGEHRQIL
jgi:GntP family gluconate:H+ symporter